jgi:hypothetical protein
LNAVDNVDAVISDLANAAAFVLVAINQLENAKENEVQKLEKSGGVLPMQDVQ